jgi:hypothetical protein
MIYIRQYAIDPKLATENVRVDFDFVEDADATTALAPATVTWTNGPALGDATTPKLFPFQVTWNEPTSGAAEIVVVAFAERSGGSGGKVGAPMVRDVMAAYFELKAKAPAKPKN